MRRRAVAAVVLAALAFRAAAPAAVRAADLTIVGTDGAAHTLTQADLSALPAETLEASFRGERGVMSARFAGPLLWSVLTRAGVVAPEPRGHVRMTVVTTGADGYTAVLALGEIDPAFEGKKVLVATMQDGAPVGGTGLRQVVPGDARGGRSVRDVVRIAIESRP
jgi:hypothetical protein